MPAMRHTVYEQPLNERMRTLLRVEFLLRQYAALADQSDEWSGRGALAALLDLLDLLTRTDLRSELLKEADRIRAALAPLVSNPMVDTSRLQTVLDELAEASTKLQGRGSPLEQFLRDHELLRAVKQRIHVPAGTCGFDLPVLHHWLQRSAAERQPQWQQWHDQLSDLRHAMELILRLVRESGVTRHEQAVGGFYQQNGTDDDSAPVQLLRVLLPTEATLYPDISAGRQRFTIRFMQPVAEGADRPVQSSETVDFLLSRCAL